MTKTQQYYQLMITQNEPLFDKFREIHDAYAKNPKANQEIFNEVGGEVLDLVRRYENLLCNSTESSGYNKFSTNLSEKFQAEVKSAFPKINSVGLETS